MGQETGIVRVLMSRDGMSRDEALNELHEGRELVAEYLANGRPDRAYDVCQELWRLEPDYITELI